MVIAGRCITAKCTPKLIEAGYIKGIKQGHAEIPSSLNCISENLDHRVGSLCSHADDENVDGDKLLEKRRSEIFHGWVEARREGWRESFL